ncbi:hypothetical protein Vretimale_17210 [Volvox reticuliferus]|uniref:Aldehyde dehydrogenase domain-containing protein n=1 Tax=Volvox reticuliferus TaxID=1737510 RepID=A0A8J4BVT5_9CHLO|nr:hypothetical protein Vretifemale_119 [Volvox reticuliferus]GIM14335.1 hypothetical protein Vretimale_17210 [Volvox reticuliferus]
MRSAVLDNVATSFEYYAGQAEALGLAGLITPWNYPLLMAPWKVVPALAARCCAVLKPSELASLTCLELAAIAAEVQLPPGVLNVVTGTGPGAGAPLRCGATEGTDADVVREEERANWGSHWLSQVSIGRESVFAVVMGRNRSKRKGGCEEAN